MALLRDAQVVAQTTWQDDRLNNRHLFTELPGFLDAAQVAPKEIALFAVGLGPGVFSGLRVSLSAIQGLALPGRTPVRGISSGMAMARSPMAQREAGSVAVVGDARRNRFWIGTFSSDDDGLPVVREDYRLVPADAFTAQVKDVDLIVTPDWERIGARLCDYPELAGRLVEGAVLPCAEDIGQLACLQQEKGLPFPPMPLTPIYLHPPVFVEPRFPGAAPA